MTDGLILKLKNDIVKAAKEIYNKDLVEAGEGNISARIPEKEELLITPTFNKYYDLTPEEVVQIKFDGTLLSETRKPSTEYRLHVDIYKARPRAQFVIHSHSPFATMLSVARIHKLPVLLEEQVIFLGGTVNVSEFARAHTHDFGKKAIEAMGTKNGVILANHGTLACGRNVEHAIKMIELIEKLSRIYYGATQMGGAYEIAEESCSRFLDNFDKEFATHTQVEGKCD
ncbi:MAG: L-fuculose phosphate aldolase [Promethearchaeota archaeon]|nr:MAG: L-fuculose phosphate aldolase [Candidatus Lokiarchaeota archaeon]